MSMWPKQSKVHEFYGNPDTNFDGQPDPIWEQNNLVSVAPTYRMVLAWDKARVVQRIRVHRHVKGSLSNILTRVRDLYGNDQEKIEADGLHLFGGAYNFRLMRGGTSLSMHSYGCAIDLDPTRNPLGKAWSQGMMPMKVVAIFEEAGWVWGGRWKRPDCQHFQAAIA